jgi:hypothetical protein
MRPVSMHGWQNANAAERFALPAGGAGVNNVWGRCSRYKFLSYDTNCINSQKSCNKKRPPAWKSALSFMV